MRTEIKTRFRSIAIDAPASPSTPVSSQQSADAEVPSRPDFLEALRGNLPEELRNLQKGNIAPFYLALAAIRPGMAVERAQGFEPRDVSKENRAYDIESLYPKGHSKAGQLRFIQVKGRVAGAETVTVTKKKIATALNKPAEFFRLLSRNCG